MFEFLNAWAVCLISFGRYILMATLLDHCLRLYWSLRELSPCPVLVSTSQCSSDYFPNKRIRGTFHSINHLVSQRTTLYILSILRPFHILSQHLIVSISFIVNIDTWLKNTKYNLNFVAIYNNVQDWSLFLKGGCPNHTGKLETVRNYARMNMHHYNSRSVTTQFVETEQAWTHSILYYYLLINTIHSASQT